MGGLLGGPKGMLPPLSNYWGGGGGGAAPLPPLFLRVCIRRVIPYFDTTCPPVLNTEPDPVRPGSTLLVVAYASRFMRYRVNKNLAMYNLHDSSM